MEWFSLVLMVGVALAAERGGDEPVVSLYDIIVLFRHPG